LLRKDAAALDLSRQWLYLAPQKIEQLAAIGLVICFCCGYFHDGSFRASV